MKHLLVPIDFSDTTAPVNAAVETIAKAFECTVHYLHVISSVADKDEWDLMRHAQSQFATRYSSEFGRLQAMASEMRERGCEADALILQGPVVQVILHEIERLRADFVIIGSHGHGALYEMLVGSVCEGVLRKATCPVIIVPGLKRVAARHTLQGMAYPPGM